MFSEIVINKYFLLATHFKAYKKNYHFPQNQVLQIADINFSEFFKTFILVCCSYENGKNLPALLNLTKSVIVVHPNPYL
jgi:hypothetical protein